MDAVVANGDANASCSKYFDANDVQACPSLLADQVRCPYPMMTIHLNDKEMATLK